MNDIVKGLLFCVCFFGGVAALVYVVTFPIRQYHRRVAECVVTCEPYDVERILDKVCVCNKMTEQRKVR